MSLIDVILNLAGLLLWLHWRAVPFDPLTRATPATLVGTLRRAEPTRVKRWHFLAALAGLLVFRAWLYGQLGPGLNWAPRLNLVATQLVFKSADPHGWQPLLFSLLSFTLFLGIFFLWLLLLSLLARGSGESLLPLQLARVQLGFVSGWPAWKKLLLPLVAGLVLWWLLSWPLAAWGLIPKPGSNWTRLAQAALVGSSTYFAWQYLMAALLTFQLLHNHVYLGRHPVWNFVDLAGRRLLGPLQRLPLRVGRVDLTPVVGIVLVFLVAHLAENGVPPSRLDAKGRRETQPFAIPGLIELYERASR